MTGIDFADALASSVTFGVSVRLLAGKDCRYLSFTYLAVRLGIGKLLIETS